MKFTWKYVILLATTIPIGSLAQTVSTIKFDQTIGIDGITFYNGKIIAASAWNGSKMYEISLDGKVTTIAEGLKGPIQIVVDKTGNYFASNFSDEGTVSKITPDGKVSSFATVSPGAAGLVFDKSGNLYVSVFGNYDGNTIYKVTPSGETSVYASGNGILAPIGIAFDENENLYVANSMDGQIHKVSKLGKVTLFAQIPKGPGQFSTGHLVYGNHKLYASGNSNHKVFEISMTGVVNTLAGTGDPAEVDGKADQAQFIIPNGLALSDDGKKLYVMKGGGRPDKDGIRVIELSAR